MNTAFIAGIVLNFVFVIIEVVAGLYYNSLSLLSDAGHNLADVGALAISLFAFKMLKVKSNAKYTYGYRKNFYFSGPVKFGCATGIYRNNCL